MRRMRVFPLFAVASVCVLSAVATAQRFAPTVRIVDRIDESNLVTLKGNTHPAANAKNDLGRVSDDLPMTDLILVLSRDAAQQAAFEKFVASQYDSTSPNFHQWLTPEQVGENFGPSQTDIATVTSWLTGHGFTVSQVTKDRMSIRFSGTAGLVRNAFHTEIHHLQVKGETHIGNMSDPQIPAALGPMVVGVKALHNFFPRPLHHLGSLVTHDSSTGMWKRNGSAATTRATGNGVRTATALGLAAKAETSAKPQFGISVGGSSPYLVEDVGPWDFATIYNVVPLWNAGIDGTGQTIAIAGTSDILPNDVATFRTFFDLPTSNAANTPIRMSGNSQPLTVCNSTTNTLCGQGDLIENSLDVEWSGAVAKNAQIVLVASYPASASDDNLYDSESYIVDNLTARIMNVSYGECERFNGTAGNVQYYDLWQTAAAEGIAVFVASGDSGAASCDQGGDANGVPYPAEYGLSVSGLASTPYNTAVGGTDFNWCSLTSTTECTPAPYWSSTNDSTTRVSALGYVPEVPWNDTCASPLALGWMENFFSGVYTVTDAESGCNAFVVNATLISNAGLGGDLYLVDTVGGGGGASGCVVNTSTSTTTGTCTAGATRTGATSNPDTGAAQGSLTVYPTTTGSGWPKPSWQTQAVNNVPGLLSDGVRDLPDVSFFASDGFLSSSAYLICVSDVTACSYSSRQEPTAQEVGGTSVATPAMAGVMALINQKAGAVQGSPNAELYKLAAAQSYSNCKAESVATSSNCYFNDIDTGTNAMVCDYSAYTTVPSPNCNRIHSGDYVGILTGNSAGLGYDMATGLGSLNVANVVNAWPATTPGNASATVTVTPAQSSINSNNTLDVTVTVAGGTGAPKDPNGQTVTPTGTVTLTASGSSYSGTVTLSNAGSAAFSIPANSLGAPGSTLTAKYGGDVVYGTASNTAAVTVTTIVQLAPTVTVTPASTTLNSNASLNVAVTVGGAGITPTGTVKLSGGGIGTALSGTLVNGSYTFPIAANTLSAGPDTLTATYNGDANYASGSNSATVTVTESTFSLTGTAIAVSPTTIAPGSSATATVTVAATAGYTGTVTLTCQLQSTTATGGDGASCTGGGPPGITIPSATQTVVFTVGTTAKVADLVYPKVRGGGWIGAGGGAVLALLVFLGIPARRRNWRTMLGMLVLLATLGSLSACGGGGGGGSSSSTPPDPGTTAGTYTFLVQATGNPSVTPAVSTTFTVTVN